MANENKPRKFIIMGVSGCGKSSVGSAVAEHFDATFVDGDDLHPKANVEKMASGQPLNDVDRAPWLAIVGDTLASSDHDVILACSALKRSYRDMIRTAAGGAVTFLHCYGDKSVILARQAARKDHFMPDSLVDSQFATLEPLGDDEDKIEVDVDQNFDQVVGAFIRAITRRS